MTQQPTATSGRPTSRDVTSVPPAGAPQHDGAARRRMTALTEVWADSSHAARRRMELDRPWLTAAR